jgi:hypothetical protein
MRTSPHSAGLEIIGVGYVLGTARRTLVADHVLAREDKDGHAENLGLYTFGSRILEADSA